MGSATRNWYITIIILVTFYSYLLSYVQSNSTFNSNSLDNIVHDYAIQALKKTRTGSLHNVSLPANYSGIHASVARVRSGSFWTNGVNFSSFTIPPRILPSPFVKRLALVYQDLGNLSTLYYEVPGYKLVSPVLGFFAYDASNFSALGNSKLNLSVMGEPISVRFPLVSEKQNGNLPLKCVKFDVDGVVEMSNTTSVPNVCHVESEGHFCIVVPYQNDKERLCKWWVVGFMGGFVGLVLIGLIVIFVFKFVRKKRIAKMEKESENGVAFDTMWIGRSKLPSASRIRTLPSLENDYIP